MIIFSRWGFMAIAFGVVAAGIAADLDRQYALSPELFDILLFGLWGTACILLRASVGALGGEGSAFSIPPKIWGFGGFVFAVALLVAYPGPRRDEASGLLLLMDTAAAHTPDEPTNAIFSASATPAPEAKLVPVSASISQEAQAAYNYLAKNLTDTSGQVFYVGHFEAVDGDICHIRDVENVFLLGTHDWDVHLADVDLATLEVRGDPTAFRALKVSAAADKVFYDSEYDSNTDKWGEWTEHDAVYFILAGNNENAILRAFATLATECGAKAGF